MQHLVESFINSYGYIAIFIIVAMENSLPFIPSEIVLTFIGYMSLSTNINPIIAIVVATIGAVFGSLILYWVGTWIDHDRLVKFTNTRISKLMRLKIDDFDRAEKLFDKYEKPTVFFARFIPVIRALISIPAGMTKMNLSMFVILTAVGQLIWNIVLIYAGRLAGEAYQQWSHQISNASHILVLIIGLIILGVVGWFVYDRFIKNSAKK